MRNPSLSWTLRIAAGAIAVGGAVAACFNDVPAPQNPLVAPREVSPQAPTPGPILPTPHLAPDPEPAASVASMGVPTPRVPAASPTRLDVPAAAPADAGVPPPDSAADLPAEVPDAGAAVTSDAGIPL